MELTVKKSYARVGMGLFLFVVITVVAQIAVGAIARVAGLEPEAGSPLLLVLNFAPMYCIALPISLRYLAALPAPEAEGEEMTAGRFVKLLLVCFPIMYIGNVIGTALSALLSGDSAENPLVALTAEMSIWSGLVIVVIGPLVEELFFRRAILSRVSIYGEKTAILYAALAFGLFHMNLFQFFYAFGLGLVFGYVYVRTRKLRWGLILHMAVNFMGSVVAPWAAGQVDLDALANAAPEEAAAAAGPGLAIFGAYMAVYFALVVAGVIVFLRHRKEIHLTPAEEEPGKAACLTPGFILFTLACLVMIVASLVM